LGRGGFYREDIKERENSEKGDSRKGEGCARRGTSAKGHFLQKQNRLFVQGSLGEKVPILKGRSVVETKNWVCGRKRGGGGKEVQKKRTSTRLRSDCFEGKRRCGTHGE